MPRSDLAPASLLAGPPPSAPDHFDPSLQQAVEHFQRRHGLDVDGIVGRDTRAALNVPVQERINQIILNMERWRWMPRDLGATHVLVNMAGFELDFIEDRRPALSMRVVVGTPDQRTPVFSDKITYLEFNPYWNIPYSIASKEILPLIQRDPGYLADRGIRVFTSWAADAAELDPWYIDWWEITPRSFPFRLRQDPGRHNPLGRVKFMLPNRFAVYLHDTSSPSLFHRTVRTFSHGCIRVEKPAELAELLLRHNPGWDLKQIESAMNGGARRIATLKRPVPVHLIYATAWSAADGTVQFRRDIYERDSLLFNMLFNETR
jgi:L,D-transpeptidase YcbB